MLMPPRSVRLSARITLFSISEPGAPKTTIPPSVASTMVLFRTTLLVHANEIPSAHLPSVQPAGPIWLFSTSAPVHLGTPPSKMWMVDQLRVSKALTSRITWPEAEPPACMSASPSSGPRRGRSPSTITLLSTTSDRPIMKTAVTADADARRSTARRSSVGRPSVKTFWPSALNTTGAVSSKTALEQSTATSPGRMSFALMSRWSPDAMQVEVGGLGTWNTRAAAATLTATMATTAAAAIHFQGVFPLSDGLSMPFASRESGERTSRLKERRPEQRR